ncbi:telomerase-binding protein EST1A isoform X1 [Diorhabda carinulata]|uniref:telomerase-binding protein EST1A isoform X1 n=1 Tax=Diorhabda carinulata TaxID=1163345 RepID=UPI0025A246FE|nr:telomerase-binding protein EST1A isoform X1 [Diorhabda carinulata]
MRRGKPPQQLYRPGSGPLKKSSTIEESDSDTNIFNSRHKQEENTRRDNSKFHSESSSPRERIKDIDRAITQLGDISLNNDVTRRPKKPDQERYVPRPLAQSRELNSSQDMTSRNTFAHINGTNSGDRGGHKRTTFIERHQADQKNDWREEAARQRQQVDTRGMNNGPNNSNWNRTRDTRSVEPSGQPNRNYNTEKVQSKPPSGRRHSTVEVEMEKRYNSLPPRLKKKMLEECGIQPPPVVEENSWDGSSVTFQKNTNFFHPGDAYYTLPMSPTSHHQNIHYGSNTLPGKGRGRGRSNYDQDMHPQIGVVPYDSLTPNTIKSPVNSRPCSPPIGRSRPQTPINDYTDNRRGTRRHDDPGRGHDRRDNNHKRDFPHRRDGKNFNRDRDNFNHRDNYNCNRDNYSNKEHYNQRWEEDYRDSRNKDRNRDYRENHGNNRRDRNGRNNRDQKRGAGGGNRDRLKDNRGEIDKRNRGRDHFNPPADIVTEENWDDELSQSSLKQNQEMFNREEIDFRLNMESAINAVMPTTLDWSEEVELHDRLESEYLSDALTRSSSIVSLQEVGATKCLSGNVIEPSISSKKSRRRNRQRSRNRSRQRDDSHSRTRHNNRTRKNSTTSIDSRDSFRVSREPCPSSSRRNSRDTRDPSYDSYHNNSRNVSRDNSWDRHTQITENWRQEIERKRNESEKDITNVDTSTKKAGVIVLPQQNNEVKKPIPTLVTQDHPRYPDNRRYPGQQKSLYDPNNPNKPIIVKSASTRVSVPGFSDNNESVPPPQMYTTDQFGNIRPPWYDETSDSFKSCHYPDLLRDIKRADNELQYVIKRGLLLLHWDQVDQLRCFLKEALEYLICKSIKFCQTEKVEQHFWNILYHNIIEITRKAIKDDHENKEKYKGLLLNLIDEGTKYYERLISLLEKTFDFKVSNYLKENMVSHKGLGLVGMALISCQKLFLFLGDLGRYREEVNETCNYGKCRQWYIKSHEINPKNGKPYNQLAILAVYARRKLDAVYYYMRSLMSSNPVPSAWQDLISLFDENRRKYEQGEKKRREERLEKQRLQMKQKESEDSNNTPGSLRKETWIHPEGGRRVYRTTKANIEQNYSDDEDLSALSSVEVNKRFVITYLHVHGKLITKIGMESFQETAMQMLKEFRALLQHSPVPIPCNRLLQLLALNMYAIDTTQLKDPQLQSQPGYRSELQERALIVSLQMFNLILERCVSILQDYISSQKEICPTSFPPDANVLLPAVKIWCDWLLCHTGIWNPPPSTQDFRVGSPGDCWSRLATLMNLLEPMDQSQAVNFIKDPQEGYEPVRLPEDSVLCGFTPLLYTSDDTIYASKDVDIEAAHFTHRLNKLLFFGTVYLCGIDPPVLKLEIEDDVRDYVSVVCTSNSRDSPPNTELRQNNEVLLESFSDDNGDERLEEKITSGVSTEIRDLLTRKGELEKRRKSQELHLERVKKILSQSVVSVHVEVRPKYLVPDTNCFIDHLTGIRKIAQTHTYTLMVPIVVISELEGLSRGGKVPAPDSRSTLDPQHVQKVATSARDALDFLKTRHASVKCVTTKGAIIPSTNFSTEDDSMWDNSFRNDDKILTTCLGLCKEQKDQTTQDVKEGEPRRLVREVVLLTDDRNLRVKAYARDVPVRELPDFMRWAGLG